MGQEQRAEAQREQQAQQAEAQREQQAQQAELLKANREFAEKLGLEEHKQRLADNIGQTRENRHLARKSVAIRNALVGNMTNQDRQKYETNEDYFNMVNGIIATAALDENFSPDGEDLQGLLEWVSGSRKKKPGFWARAFGAR